MANCTLPESLIQMEDDEYEFTWEEVGKLYENWMIYAVKGSVHALRNYCAMQLR